MSDFIQFNGYSLRKDAVTAVSPVLEYDGGMYTNPTSHIFRVYIGSTTFLSQLYHHSGDASAARSKLLRDLDPNLPL